MKRSIRVFSLVAAAALSLEGAAWAANPGDVAVDSGGNNRGDLATGALLFGGQEPNDPVKCALSVYYKFNQVPPPTSCPPVATMEGIASARKELRVGNGSGVVTKVPKNQYGLDFYTDNAPRLSITHAGNIGIGTQTPTYTVDVENSGDVQIALFSEDVGGTHWTIQSSGKVDPTKVGTFQIVDRDQNKQRLGIDSHGMVTVNSLQITGGSDLAEPFKTTQQLPPGSLVVIDPSQPGRLLPSTRAYDRRVAGVVSGANHIQPGVMLEQLNPGQGRQQVALSGRVYALADTSNGPIRPGDLLTTSGNAAHAMKATDLQRAQGAIIGKAMSSLDHGEGFVLILVSLQ